MSTPKASRARKISRQAEHGTGEILGTGLREKCEAHAGSSGSKSEPKGLPTRGKRAEVSALGPKVRSGHSTLFSPEQMERLAFEWLCRETKPVAWEIDQDSKGRYKHPSVEFMWQGWKARAEFNGEKR
jgi:hypothetical protein